MSNLYGILERTAANHPDNRALIFNDQQVSYEKLKEVTDRLASALKRMGLGVGDRMALMLPNVPHFTMSYFALLKIGVTIIPVSILYKSEEIHHQLEDSEVKGIIFWEGFRQSVRKAVQGLERCERLIVLGKKIKSGEHNLTGLMAQNEPLEEAADVASDDTALIVYTAGTTGQPRGAELTHGNISSNIDACCQFLNIGPEDGIVGVIPMYHLLGQTLVMGTAFNVGARVILLPKFDPSVVLQSIETEKATYFVGVPSMYRQILRVENDETYDVRSLKHCLSSGDKMTQETMDAFEEKFKVSILEGYGLSEASPVVSFNTPSRVRKAGSIGLPLPGIEMKIVDETGTEVRPGEIGEIIVQGPNVMKGYLNRPEATKEALKDGWLHTGDLARLDESGFGFVVARQKNVIVKGGFNVYPQEVEKFLYGHPKVKEAVVVGIPDALHGEEIHACIVLRNGERATQEEMIAYVKERMAAYKCPKVIHFLPSLPMGPTGRIQRDEIRSILKSKHA